MAKTKCITCGGPAHARVDNKFYCKTHQLTEEYVPKEMIWDKPDVEEVPKKKHWWDWFFEGTTKYGDF